MKRTSIFALASVLLLCVFAAWAAIIVDYVDAKERLALHDQLWHLSEQCTPIILWLETEKMKTGGYPQELPPEMMKTIQEFKPRGRYGSSNSNQFGIGCGEYSVDGFEYYWQSEKGAWWWNG